MRVLIRCDATHAGGVGHLARSLAIAEAAAADGWEVVLAGRIEAPIALAMLENSSARVSVEQLPLDGRALAARAAELEVNVLHVDDYTVDAGLRDSLAPLGIALSSMEDGRFGRRAADLVIDPSPAAFASMRPLDRSRRVVGGAQWVPLRDELRHIVPEESRSGVAIMMGGTDAFQMSPWAMRVLRACGYDGPACVVTADERTEALARELDIEIVPPSPQAMARVGGSRFAILAAGTSLWEAVALDVPCAVVAVTENQELNYVRATQAGAAVGLGLRHVALDPDAAARVLEDAMSDPVRPSSRIRIDGRGAQRIVRAWAWAADIPSGLLVRDVTEGDASVLFAWRNDPVVRAVSRTGDQLEWAEHLDWVRRLVADETRAAFIVELEGEPAATVRFDELDESDVEVSITLAPDLRGRGLGGPVLQAATAEASRRRPQWRRVIAEVRNDNLSSLRLFERAGYVLWGESSEPGFARWAFELPATERPS